MPVKYYKLFDLLNRRGMKKTDLLNIISAPTLAKLSKGKTVTTEVIANICEYLHCQPGDIMEYIPQQDEPNQTTPASASNDDDFIPEFMREDYVPPKKEPIPESKPQKTPKRTLNRR